MEQKIKELKEKIQEAENNLKDPDISSDAELVMLVTKELEDAKKELSALESESSKAVEKAEEKVEDKVDKVIRDGVKHGGQRRGAGRPRIEKMPPMKRKSMARPAKYKPKSDKPVFVRKKKATKKEVVKLEKGKVKTVRAFGQTVEYRNDSEFCSQLIKAFKKRRTVYKSKKKRTKPVFGVITSKVKDAVTKAIDNAPKAEIKENPKAFLAKAQRLEKSAIKFLEDFKAILGSDYKKSEISAEFGDLEKSIKQLVSKYK